ncbi:permease-like cell division protein FtsX [Candidatus Methylocalor cossyra]|uniref:Cell division protein FtsX n=1 Tax=Candidatus Methylocalor cossyra TaxID=3108543 RepID=A0ABP1CBR8_9GAMM
MGGPRHSRVRRGGAAGTRPLGSRLGLPGWIEAQWAWHGETLRASFARLWRTPLASTLTILVIALSLMLPASLHGLVRHARQAGAGLEMSSQISLFLKPELSDQSGHQLAERLKAHPDIADAQVIGKEAGLQELRSYGGFGEIVEVLGSNPLPAVVSLKPKDSADPARLEKLVAELGALPETDFVQFDSAWLSKLRALLTVAERAITVFGAVLGSGVLVTVGNTVRLEFQSRREEIEIAKLLGATDGFIARPFVYAGFWYSLLGGALAHVLANLLLLALQLPVAQLAELYGSSFRLGFLNLRETELLLGGAVALGMAGAWLVVRYELWRLCPR